MTDRELERLEMRTAKLGRMTDACQKELHAILAAHRARAIQEREAGLDRGHDRPEAGIPPSGQGRIQSRSLAELEALAAQHDARA